jgi:O-antigen/teichoic acid export membrane protein
MKLKLLEGWLRLWRSTIAFAAFSTAVRLGAQILLLPLVLRYLTQADQAMWWVFVALGNFANLADFGFGQGISRVYNYFWAGADDFDAEGLRPALKREPNFQGLHTLNYTVRYLYLRLSVAAVLVLGAVGAFYLCHAVPATARTQRFWFLWFFYLLGIGLNFGVNHWVSACSGVDRVRAVHAAYLFSSLGFLVVAFILLRNGFGLASMVAATGVRGIVVWQVGRTTFSRAVGMVKGGKPDFGMLRRLWPNARKFGVLSLGGYFLTNGSVLLSRYYLGVRVTASFGLANQIGNFLINFSSLWVSIKWPKLTVLRTQGALQEMSLLFARRLSFAIVSFVCLAAVIVICGNPLLEWRHYNARLLSTPCMIVYFLYLLQQLFYTQFGILTFTENVVPFVRVGLATTVAMLILSIVMIPRWGIWGLILAPFIAESAGNTWVTTRRGFSGQPLPLRQFIRAGALGRI